MYQGLQSIIVVDVKQASVCVLGLGIAVLCLGLTVRSIIAFIVAFRLGLNWKEKFFIPIAWLPKATVQVNCWPPLEIK